MPFKKNPLWNHVDEVINLYEESGSLSYSGKQIVEKYGYNISSV